MGESELLELPAGTPAAFRAPTMCAAFQITVAEARGGCRTENARRHHPDHVARLRRSRTAHRGRARGARHHERRCRRDRDAQKRGLDLPLAKLVEHDAIRAEIERGIAAANDHLSRVEQIKRLPDEWLPGGDELTPTMKLKRKPIAAKYATQIDALYA